MLHNSLILYFSYFVLTFISLWIIIRHKTHELFKVFFIPFVFILAISTYFTVESLKGTPIRISSIEGKVWLHWSIISKQTNQIFLWISKLDSITPIAYVIPYNKEIANKLQKANKKTKKGYKVIIQNINTDQFSKISRDEKGKFFKYKTLGKFPSGKVTP